MTTNLTMVPAGRPAIAAELSGLPHDGEEMYIAKRDLVATAARHHVEDGYSLAGYLNQDSFTFRGLYRATKARTFIRGSLRYEGNLALVGALA